MNLTKLRAGVLLCLVCLPLPAAAVDLNKLFGSPQQGGLGLGSVISKFSQAQSMDLQKEQEVGQQFAATLLGSAPLLAEPGTQAYVNRVGRWISLHTDRANQPWRFGVLDTPTVNAFATPGGYVFITRGLLERLNNETELAGVLAHEIGHVIAGHHVNAIRQGAFLDLGAALIQQKLGDNNPELNQRLANAVRNIYSKGLDKGAEYEADQIGVVLAARAGFDPYGLPFVLQTLDAASSDDGAFSLMFKTHPPAQQRLEKLLAVMEPLNQYAGASDLNADFSHLRKASYSSSPPASAAASPLIQALQSELSRLGYNPGPSDGKMGKKTTNAIMAYQQVNHLLVDAQPSQALLDHIRAGGKGSPTAMASPQPAASPGSFDPLVHQIQVELTNRGFNPGPANGLVTPQTGIAIVNYQQAYGLPIDGRASGGLLHHMRSTAQQPVSNSAYPSHQPAGNPAAGAAGTLINEIFKNLGQ